MLTARRTGPPLRAGLVLFGVVLGTKVAFGASAAPAGVLVFGGVIGLLYALLAFGLILVHKASRIINFAQAEIGAAAAVLALLLVKVHGLPYLVALPLALVVGMLSGAVVEVLVVRRFANASRLVLSVATIGLSLVFGAVQLILPVAFGATTDLGIDPTPIKTPLSGLELEIHPVIFDGNSIAVVLGAAAVLAGLTAFFRFTEIGYAVRATAENADRALLLGVPVGLVSNVVWVLAGALSALALFLRVPLTGLPIGNSIGPVVLLYGLAAAVIARMDRFGTALVAAVSLGILEQAVFFSTRDALAPVAITLPVVLVAILFQRRGQSRSGESGTATWSLAAHHGFVPAELRGLPEVRWGRRAGLAALGGVVLVVPHHLGPTQQILASVVVIYGIVAVSLVVLTGWSGQISLGQWGFAGLGAAVAGGVATRMAGDFFVALLLAGLVGAAVAVVIGVPALRIQGLHLAVTTLAFAVAVQVLVLNRKYFDWLLPPSGRFVERPVIFGRFDTSASTRYFYVCLVVLVLCLASVRALRQSRAGRVLISVRDNQRGAESFGVDTRTVRLWAFAISGFWAAVAGALFVYHQGTIDNSAFGPEVSLTLLVIAVIGGSTSLPGALLGTLFIAGFRYSGLSSRWQMLGTGTGALLLLMFLPGGLAHLFFTARDRLLRAVAARRRIVVPSLVADVRVEAGTDTGADTHTARSSPAPAAEFDVGSISLEVRSVETVAAP